MAELEIRVWDVGHGLSVWIRTPNGQNHWIDAGYNPDGDFSPSTHVRRHYNDCYPISFLVISHPDKDHFDDLHTLIAQLGKPHVLYRNRSLPDDVKFDSGQFEYQKAFKDLDKSFTNPVDWSIDPMNPACNGGINVIADFLSWEEAGNINNSSVVIVYHYSDTVVVFPGDLEAGGWKALYPRLKARIDGALNQSKYTILVAPHHGRKNGFSDEMFEALSPDLAIISDEYGREPTDRRFRERPNGIVLGGEPTKYISTKNNQRVLIVVGSDGLREISVA